MTDEFVFDEKEHAYFLNGKPMLGCTSVLGVIAKPALIQWAANEACKHVTAAVKERIEAGLSNDNIIGEIDEILAEAKTAHRRKKEDAADKGTDLHALVEEYVGLMIADQGGTALAMNDDPTHKWAPIMPFIQWAQKEEIRLIASEQRLYSKNLWVAGTCDLIFEKDGKRYIGDIKTYKKLWDRVPLIQCAGYSIMWEEMKRSQVEKEVGHSVDFLGAGNYIDGYCVICLPKEREFQEEKDVLWSWDTEGDKEAFVSAVKLYKYLQVKI